ncbi:hypothetical protein KUCAC02_012493 [Chaenocephalus aceratus]|uniref:Uncharacterized protein n=1 Tax=Chaenocephalus aceratus TaxID=36190 RepID=A0ACB9XAQ6_CHAAC|nr:hypothetical protein KUCAC02_012493 [Chaenocephalus aceratus]
MDGQEKEETEIARGGGLAETSEKRGLKGVRDKARETQVSKHKGQESAWKTKSSRSDVGKHYDPNPSSPPPLATSSHFLVGFIRSPRYPLQPARSPRSEPLLATLLSGRTTLTLTPTYSLSGAYRLRLRPPLICLAISPAHSGASAEDLHSLVFLSPFLDYINTVNIPCHD